MKRHALPARARMSLCALQRGLSLVFALLALAAISLAAVALVRSVDSGSLVIGNLGFKQDTTRAADRAAETARAWLAVASASLAADGAAGTGYYAQVPPNLDPTGQTTSAARRMAVINWGDPDSCACVAAGTCSTCAIAPSNEFLLNEGTVRARYVITRLCPSAGAPSDTNACAQPAGLNLENNPANSGESYGDQHAQMQTAQAPYYRIIVRTVGGRNTVSFTETIVH
jgi:type IV pilus assembly protein PilX